MKIRFIYILAIACLSISITYADDENHEIIAKVMKEGLKGKTSPLAKTLSGIATDEEIAELSKLIKTLKGTTAPIGDQAEYDQKIAALIKTAEIVANGDKSQPALDRFEEAANCKACHSAHKP